jgi:hypothetical protein
MQNSNKYNHWGFNNRPKRFSCQHRVQNQCSSLVAAPALNLDAGAHGTGIDS